METYEIKFESNCDYDGAIEYFEKQMTAISQIKEVLGKPSVYKNGDFWIIKQEIKLSLKASLRLIWLKLLNKF